MTTPQPLVRWVTWDGTPGEGSEPTVAGTGELDWVVALGPAGLTCRITPRDKGGWGQTRYALELTNGGTIDQHGMLLPPGTDWLGAPRGSGDGGFCLAHDRVFLGPGDGHYAWPPREFAKDVFAAVPGPEGTSITAVLVRLAGGDDGKERGGLLVRPGETVTLELHLDTVSGDRNAALNEIWRVRGGYRVDPSRYDRSLYRAPGRAWVSDIVVSWLNWAWDEELMDPVSGEYRLAESLERARRVFGGYDVYMLWPFWPRAGFDDRFQFDHFRDLPGGLAGVRDLVRRVQALGTRMIVSYCVWSESDRDATPAGLAASFRKLVELALDVEADGVLMDIMSATPPELLEMARARGRELTPFNEGDPSWAESQVNLVGRIHNNFPMPRFSLKKYLLPHHPLLRVAEPGNLGKVMRNDIGLSFFQGHGVEVNTMFPQKSPATDPDWALLALAAGTLRAHRACFRSPGWEPFVRTAADDVWANRWPAAGKTLYTLCCTDPQGHRGEILRLPHDGLARYVDLWRHREIEPRVEGSTDVLSIEMEGFKPGLGMERGTGDYSFGCVAVLRRRLSARLDFETLTVTVDSPRSSERIEVWIGQVRPDGVPVTRAAGDGPIEIDLWRELGRHTNEAVIVRLLDTDDQVSDVAVVPESVIRFFRIDKPSPTRGARAGSPPTGMLSIPAGRFTYTLRQTQSEFQATYAHTFQEYRPEASYVRDVTVSAFWMDRYPVTDAEYAVFLRATGYTPRDGYRRAPVAGADNLPAVHVSYHDAQAYAAWAGKRLPTEEEWAWAAGGGDARAWPWGDEEPDATRCAQPGAGPQPVDSHPRGASPFGVEDLVGNVWQWTSSLMHNGRHQLVYLRGGSWYRPPEGMWWILGGPRRITDHIPLPLFGPAMNRLSTVGFRCVMD